jgi:hypothetical protein
MWGEVLSELFLRLLILFGFCVLFLLLGFLLLALFLILLAAFVSQNVPPWLLVSFTCKRLWCSYNSSLIFTFHSRSTNGHLQRKQVAPPFGQPAPNQSFNPDAASTGNFLRLPSRFLVPSQRAAVGTAGNDPPPEVGALSSEPLKAAKRGR